MAVTAHVYVGRRGRTTESVYACCIRYGPITATDIAHKLGLDPSQVYDILATGQRKGLAISTLPDSKPRLYIMRHLLPADLPADLSMAGLMRWYAAMPRPEPA